MSTYLKQNRLRLTKPLNIKVSLSVFVLNSRSVVYFSRDIMYFDQMVYVVIMGHIILISGL